MAGTLVVSTLSDGTNSTSATNAIQGSAKAWVNFSMNGASLRASYNVSSVTAVQSGVTQINFTNAMSDANYSTVVSCSGDNAGSGTGGSLSSWINSNQATLRAPTASNFYVCANWPASGWPNPTYYCAAVFR